MHIFLAKDDGRIIDSLYCSQKYLTPDAMFNLSRVISDWEWCIADICGLMLPNHHYPSLTLFKSTYAALWIMNYSPPCNHSPMDKILLSLLYRYYYRRCWDKLHFLVPLVQTFTARTYHTMFMVANPPHSICVPLCNFHLASSWEDASLTNTILVFASPGSAICISYFLLPPHLQKSHLVILYIEWPWALYCGN